MKYSLFIAIIQIINQFMFMLNCTSVIGLPYHDHAKYLSL